MTNFAKRCELEALATERIKMETHDKACIAAMSGACYSNEEYDSIAARMRALAESAPCQRGGDPERWVPKPEPCNCEQAVELQGAVENLTASNDALATCIEVWKGSCQRAEAKFKEARAEVEILKKRAAEDTIVLLSQRERLGKIQHELDLSQASERLLKRERDAANLRANAAEASYRDLSNEFELAKNERDAAYELGKRDSDRLPSWIRPVTRALPNAICHRTGCTKPLCSAVYGLTKEQYWQCLEEP